MTSRNTSTCNDTHTHMHRANDEISFIEGFIKFLKRKVLILYTVKKESWFVDLFLPVLKHLLLNFYIDVAVAHNGCQPLLSIDRIDTHGCDAVAIGGRSAFGATPTAHIGGVLCLEPSNNL